MIRISHKVNMITSPKGGEGKSTIAAYTAVQFAKAGYLVGLIEVDRYFGSVMDILGFGDKVGGEIKGRSLKGAINTDSDTGVLHSFIPHPKHKDLYTLSLTLDKESKIDDLTRFPEASVKNIIKVARSKFDIVFIDCPSTYIEPGFLAPIDMGVDRLIYVIDNDITKLAGAKLYDQFFYENAVSFGDVMVVINKDLGVLEDATIKAIGKDMAVIKMDKIFTIPYYKRIIEAKNDGDIIIDATPSNGQEKALQKAITGIVKSIEDFESKGRDANAKQ